MLHEGSIAIMDKIEGEHRIYRTGSPVLDAEFENGDWRWTGWRQDGRLSQPDGVLDRDLQPEHRFQLTRRLPGSGPRALRRLERFFQPDTLYTGFLSSSGVDISERENIGIAIIDGMVLANDGSWSRFQDYSESPVIE